MMGFDGVFVEEERGHAGGIWCLWDTNIWKVDVMDHCSQVIHMKVSTGNHNPWILSAVYGSPQRINQKGLSGNIHLFRRSNNLPCYLVGDFNAFLLDSERGGILSAVAGNLMSLGLTACFSSKML
ncbi:hypothetical protein Ahy_A08g037532 isoform B [Arachis hypogaea]|uniref:Endonuclease/exonuclease/phosphatase domain-containing protein n=1 Tax=Arachis hypogaea TaxID=3818 RepID=A0A445BR62_ARAHY|nr:hypothetical protein Ahy_A08g037532 isoform B [Arachis hypogaea]